MFPPFCVFFTRQKYHHNKQQQQQHHEQEQEQQHKQDNNTSNTQRQFNTVSHHLYCQRGEKTRPDSSTHEVNSFMIGTVHHMIAHMPGKIRLRGYECRKNVNQRELIGIAFAFGLDL